MGNDVPRAINAKFKGAAFLLRICILSAVDISAVDEIQASVPAPLRATKKKKTSNHKRRRERQWRGPGFDYARGQCTRFAAKSIVFHWSPFVLHLSLRHILGMRKKGISSTFPYPSFHGLPTPCYPRLPLERRVAARRRPNSSRVEVKNPPASFGWKSTRSSSTPS
jgi:hypothetical protein